MGITLHGYQKEAQKFLSEHSKAILGDEPGVGKTYPTIAAAQQIDGSHLIVCPRYIIPNWIAYLAEMGAQDVVAVVGNTRQKQKLLEETHKWYIITYNMLGQTNPNSKAGQRYADLLNKAWGAVIYDEAHRLRGRKSKWTQMAFKLKSKNTWMLTGSPVYKQPGDIWPLLRICDPTTFSSYWRFVNEYCIVRKTMWGTEPYDVKSPHLFQTMLKTYMLRRTMDDVGIDIPALLPVRTVHSELSPANRKKYDSIKKDFRYVNPDTGKLSRVQALGVANKLRSISAEDPNKIAVLKEILEDVNERVVILTWYRATAKRVSEEIGIPGMVVTGAIDGLKRQDMFDRLEVSPKGRIVATIESMKEGLNLQHTSKVIFYEMDWTSETNFQARNRFYRFGQNKHVQVYNILTKDTIDEKVYEVAQDRGKKIDRALHEAIYT